MPKQTSINPRFKRPEAYLDGIFASPEYLQSYAETQDYPRAIGKVALGFVAEREKESPYLDLDTQAVRLIGLLDNYLSAQLKLEQLKEDQLAGKKVDRIDKLPFKKKVIEYNHALREIIDANPQLTTSDLLQFIQGMAYSVYDNEEAAYITQESRSLIVGMQHEVAAEQAIWTIEGVEDVLHADVEEELIGIDLKVLYAGRIVYLDIKSTPKLQDKARAKRHLDDKELPVWSGVTTNDLQGHFRVSPAKAADMADRFERILEEEDIVRQLDIA